MKKISNFFTLLTTMALLMSSVTTYAVIDVNNDNSGTEGSQVQPSLGFDGSANAYCVWMSTNVYGTQVIQAASKATGASTWTAHSPDPISGNGGSSATVFALNPVLAVNSSGLAVAVWGAMDYTNGVQQVFAARKNIGSNTWTNVTRLTTTTEDANTDYQVQIGGTLLGVTYVTVTWSAKVNSSDSFTRTRSASSADGGVTWN